MRAQFYNRNHFVDAVLRVGGPGWVGRQAGGCAVDALSVACPSWPRQIEATSCPARRPPAQLHHHRCPFPVRTLFPLPSPLPPSMRCCAYMTFTMPLFYNLTLQVVLEEGAGRRVIFSTFDPDCATLLSLKQPRFPVLFLTCGGTKQFDDPRMNSLDAALQFAVASQLQVRGCGARVCAWGRSLEGLLCPVCDVLCSLHPASQQHSRPRCLRCSELSIQPVPTLPTPCHHVPTLSNHLFVAGGGGRGEQRAGAAARGGAGVPHPWPLPLHLGRRQQRLCGIHGAEGGGHRCAACVWAVACKGTLLWLCLRLRVGVLKICAWARKGLLSLLLS